MRLSRKLGVADVDVEAEAEPALVHSVVDVPWEDGDDLLWGLVVMEGSSLIGMVMGPSSSLIAVFAAGVVNVIAIA